MSNQINVTIMINECDDGQTKAFIVSEKSEVFLASVSSAACEYEEVQHAFMELIARCTEVVATDLFESKVAEYGSLH